MLAGGEEPTPGQQDGTGNDGSSKHEVTNDRC